MESPEYHKTKPLYYIWLGADAVLLKVGSNSVPVRCFEMSASECDSYLNVGK
jgi:hypothetical protein